MNSDQMIRVQNYDFELFIEEEEIQLHTSALANRLNLDYATLNPVFVIVLSGAFIFAADLLRLVDIPADITVAKIKSYAGFESTGKVQILLPPDISLKDRHVVLVEDIVDTARTLHYFSEYLRKDRTKSIEICTLLSKPEAHQHELNIKYIGKEIPNDFVIGYGLDYDGRGRNLRHVYKRI